MAKDWKSHEAHVRGIAQLRWNAKCAPEHIDGVDFDGVIRVSKDEIIIIEITKERTLEKVRNDLHKIMPTKIRLATSGIICRAYIVLDSDPTNSMIEAGEAAHIPVISATEFERQFFDFDSYQKLRTPEPFGSAVDSKTGKNDPRQFIPVRYATNNGKASTTIEEIVDRTLRGDRIILTGDFGTGKSRCIREAFQKLSSKTREAGAFPIAINLRDHWSSSNALEILAGHLGNIGLSSSIDNLVRLLNSGHLILLLDGFDEIGTQTHDMRVDDRKGLRRHAVRGIRDLMEKSKAGVIITGRSHFFDSDEEMLQSLGIQNNRNEATLIEVPDSFSKDEGTQYLKSLGVEAQLPEWLPRKPLVFQVLAELQPAEVAAVLGRPSGQFEFWGSFINALCVRESRGVSNSIAPQTIKHILLSLAAKTRHSQAFLGRLSPKDIDDAYEIAVGTAPDQTGRQLLSRMCSLGRIEPESPDRQFVDYNMIDILRAEKLLDETVTLSNQDTKVQWKQSLGMIGAVHLAALVEVFDLSPPFFAYLKKYENIANTKRLGELISALTLSNQDKIDFKSFHLTKSEIPILILSEKAVANLTIDNCVINLLALDRTAIKDSDNFKISNCLISIAAGVSAASGLPTWIENTEVIDFERISNSSRIKESPILPQHKLFLSIIHKIFFQSGGGREEGSLLKGGYGQKYSPKLVESVLRLLIKEGIIEKVKGNDGWLYVPIRRYTDRMGRLRAELTLSEDQLWKDVAALRI